ncbi:MAG: sugar phosphate isomerase/epimerase [Oscillospiraceae bacterium]|jgi:sugar phosphate isomerase/epimerase|nr:sugar phosphate isomerase/epimerase [Oscillospiraceae bacterium]
MKLGAQCYTLRDYMQTERDISRSLTAIAQMGYRTVQISGVGPIAPLKLRQICDDLGLEIALTHMPPARITNDTEALIAEHELLGCRYIGLGSMPERYRVLPEWVDYFAEDFLPAAEKIRAAGMRFMYHNHNFEFERLPDGRLIMDALLDAFPPELMGVTVDTYWLQAAGCDILVWLERLQDRIPCVHLKDMTAHGMETRMAPVGGGNINFPAILKALEAAGKTEYLLVEQDYCYESPFVCLKKSYDYLAGLGYR